MDDNEIIDALAAIMAGAALMRAVNPANGTPWAVNDNHTAQTQTVSHSIALSELAGEFVVSCFECGPEGEPDYDREVFFRTFTDHERAARLYHRALTLQARGAGTWALRLLLTSADS